MEPASHNAVLIICLALPIYFVGIILPSFALNGIIVLTFARTKKLHTPSNLLSVHVSIIGLVTLLIYSTVSIPAFALALIKCDYDLVYYKWMAAHVLHFGLYPLNIAAISLSYCLILKYSSSVLSFLYVGVIIFFMWSAAIIGNAPIPFLVPFRKFVSCSRELCLNSTYVCYNFHGAFTPNLFSFQSGIFFLIQDIIFIIIPLILVLVSTTLSYTIFKASIVHPDNSLKIRMILLPIIMTATYLFLIVGQNIINWVPITMDTNNMPRDIIPLLFGLSWDLSSVIYPIIILYFNIPLRKASWNLILSFIGRASNK
uniref:G-protein coupled receptors family 1 profile domain-containing protein n=1 Tax=Amphimedon queenslandica TaxID=400682 RepID=A0A1X7VCD6_AMPQE